MKKILAMLLALVMVLGLAACGSAPAAEAPAASETVYKVAMITDYGDITDQSFNQTTYEACKAYAEANNVEFTYYKPAGDTDAERVAMIEKAIDEGYNVIVMPGFAFAGSIYAMQDVYPDVKFIALDVSEYDVHSCFYNKDENGNWTTLIDENNPEHISENVYCAVYQEELCGYMAGYAAVKLGYTKLGFLGGMAVPAVIRFGYGFVQGADAAAAELGITIDMKYAYGNQFYGDADITAVMDTWYAGGTQVVFACGGGIYTSAAEAAKKVGGKIIGVDVDQAAIIDGAYGEGMTITSAMKGLAPTTIDTLTDVVINDKWADYAGKIVSLGLVSEDPEANYVQIPMDTTLFEDGKFTVEDYKAMVAAMYAGELTVSADIVAEPAVTNSNIEWLGNLK